MPSEAWRSATHWAVRALRRAEENELSSRKVPEEDKGSRGNLRDQVIDQKHVRQRPEQQLVEREPDHPHEHEQPVFMRRGRVAPQVEHEENGKRVAHGCAQHEGKCGGYKVTEADDLGQEREHAEIQPEGEHAGDDGEDELAPCRGGFLHESGEHKKAPRFSRGLLCAVVSLTRPSAEFPRARGTIQG